MVCRGFALSCRRDNDVHLGHSLAALGTLLERYVATSQIERIQKEIAVENNSEVQTPTKLWELGLPEESAVRSSFVENIDDVLDEALTA